MSLLADCHKCELELRRSFCWAHIPCTMQPLSLSLQGDTQCPKSHAPWCVTSWHVLMFVSESPMFLTPGPLLMMMLTVCRQGDKHHDSRGWQGVCILHQGCHVTLTSGVGGDQCYPRVWDKMSRAGRHRAGPGGQECHNVVSNERGDNTGTNSAHYQTTNTGVIADWPIKAENINGTAKYNYHCQRKDIWYSWIRSVNVAIKHFCSVPYFFVGCYKIPRRWELCWTVTNLTICGLKNGVGFESPKVWFGYLYSALMKSILV